MRASHLAARACGHGYITINKRPSMASPLPAVVTRGSRAFQTIVAFWAGAAWETYLLRDIRGALVSGSQGATCVQLPRQTSGHPPTARAFTKSVCRISHAESSMGC